MTNKDREIHGLRSQIAALEARIASIEAEPEFSPGPLRLCAAHVEQDDDCGGNRLIVAGRAAFFFGYSMKTELELLLGAEDIRRFILPRMEDLIANSENDGGECVTLRLIGELNIDGIHLGDRRQRLEAARGHAKDRS